jgi:hypothetical protein
MSTHNPDLRFPFVFGSEVDRYFEDSDNRTRFYAAIHEEATKLQLAFGCLDRLLKYLFLVLKRSNIPVTLPKKALLELLQKELTASMIANVTEVLREGDLWRKQARDRKKYNRELNRLKARSFRKLVHFMKGHDGIPSHRPIDDIELSVRIHKLRIRRKKSFEQIAKELELTSNVTDGASDDKEQRFTTYKTESRFESLKNLETKRIETFLRVAVPVFHAYANQDPTKEENHVAFAITDWGEFGEVVRALEIVSEGLPSA